MIHFAVFYSDLGIRGLWYCVAESSTAAYESFNAHVAWRRRYHRDIDCVPGYVEAFTVPINGEPYGPAFHESRIVVRAPWDTTEYASCWIVVDDYAPISPKSNPLAYLRFAR